MKKARPVGIEPIVIIGRNHSGKDSGIDFQLEDKNRVVIDPRGEAVTILRPGRRKRRPVTIINPFGVLTDIPGRG